MLSWSSFGSLSCHLYITAPVLCARAAMHAYIPSPFAQPSARPIQSREPTLRELSKPPYVICQPCKPFRSSAIRPRPCPRVLHVLLPLPLSKGSLALYARAAITKPTHQTFSPRRLTYGPTLRTNPQRARLTRPKHSRVRHAGPDAETETALHRRDVIATFTPRGVGARTRFL